MSVGVILEFPNATTEQYDDVIRLMGLVPRGSGPAGLMFHWAGAAGGGLLVTDVWRSKERFDEFARDEIGPCTQQAGITAPPKTTILEVHNYLTAGDTAQATAPVGVVMDFDGDLEQYDEVLDMMGFTAEGKGPQGCLFHWAARTGGNGVRITDVWRDKQTFDTFAEQQIGPYTAKAGVPAPKSVTFHDIHNYLTSGK